ncbi:Transposon Tn21 resolvase [Pseudodesulfovibrio profundus]|uniref:Transposon Tn21 resolvase n=1 Tax=Pseudodesulfovibrio profundus TaxID=57320 RepID=A0A2C8FA30_9BACT|nr:recombinase family protein [Pseudodesulfovibrio profundus]SOB59638.1 Transposon Tn21 resolvase [Pseudodesulfovibrio profundus]
MGKQIGYIRVSTVDQNTDRQLDGVDLDKVYEEKISGSTINRPELQKCLDYLRDGDTLHVHSMDRLARSMRDIEDMVEDLTKKGINVRFHKEGWTFSAGGMDATQTLLFQMLGAVSQFERSIIRERQAEGIAKAKKAGKYKGRKPKLSKEQVDELCQRVASGDEKKVLASEFGISRQTLYRLVAEKG